MAEPSFLSAFEWHSQVWVQPWPQLCRNFVVETCEVWGAFSIQMDGEGANKEPYIDISNTDFYLYTEVYHAHT
jgi:hypothetical protein